LAGCYNTLAPGTFRSGNAGFCCSRAKDLQCGETSAQHVPPSCHRRRSSGACATICFHGTKWGAAGRS
jgi:hypothetical protein